MHTSPPVLSQATSTENQVQIQTKCNWRQKVLAMMNKDLCQKGKWTTAEQRWNQIMKILAFFLACFCCCVFFKDRVLVRRHLKNTIPNLSSVWEASGEIWKNNWNYSNTFSVFFSAKFMTLKRLIHYLRCWDWYSWGVRPENPCIGLLFYHWGNKHEKLKPTLRYHWALETSLPTEGQKASGCASSKFIL